MYTLANLPYAYNALEPAIDEQTMHLHHDKHHQTYVDNLNKALEGHKDLQKMHGAELAANLDKVPQNMQAKVRNNLGGVMNHNMFWQIMCPQAKSQKVIKKLSDLEVGKAIDKIFGSLEKFQEQFSTAGLGRFGSGWAWLVVNEGGKLEIMDTPNQDSPLMITQFSLAPILCLDVWEHAYYLKYQNRRAEYIKNWWNVVNWAEVESRFKEVSS